jgi:hypothetical protein
LALALAPACGGSSPASFDDPEAGNGGASGSSSGGGTSSGGTSSSGGGSLLPTGDGGLGSSSGSTPSTTCPNGGTTSITGTVYDPAGQNPLYNVVVYVPSSTPDPLKTGASCDSCNSLYTGNPVATATTDTSGKFTITGAPSGTNVPLVVQVGKWRRQTTVATVTACTSNAVPDKTLTLPSKSSQGDIPQIAVSTGGADSLECLLERIGLDPSEYVGGPGGTGHIHIFEGTEGAAGPVPSMTPTAGSSASLWDSVTDLAKYDVILLSCEGQATGAMNQSAMEAYTAVGGRVFASHYHYAWFNSGPFGSDNLASWTTGGNPISSTNFTNLLSIDAVIDQTLPDGGPFPKGKALSTWLGVTGALESNGDIQVFQAKHNADLSAANVSSQSWIHADTDTTNPGATQYFSFDTPVGAPLNDAGEPAYCGRVVYSDLHVGSGTGLDQDYGGIGMGGTVPTGCVSRTLTPQEKALEFMLFDLSSCVVPDSEPPPPPPPPVQPK